MKCERCERPKIICECQGGMECYASTARVNTGPWKSEVQSRVIVPYGVMSHEFGHDWPTGQSKSQINELLTDTVHIPADTQAEAFAEFLNSDAIFDCVIPRRFLS